MIFWFQFRVRQIIRLLRTAGWGILAVLLLITFPFWSRGIVFIVNADAITLGVLSFGGIGLVHLLRTDALFLQKGKHPVWQYTLTDYTGISALLALIPLVQLHLSAAVAAFSGLVWVVLPPAFIKMQQTERNKLPLHWLPPQAMEWRLVLRTQWPMYVFSALLIACSPVHIGFYAVGVTLPLASLPAAFEYLEPFALLPVSKQDTIRRWRANARWLYLWLIPTGLYFLLFQASWWPLVVYTVLNYEAILALFTAYKYNAWAPGRQRIYGGAIGSVGTMSAIVPGGLIAALALAGWYWWKLKE